MFANEKLIQSDGKIYTEHGRRVLECSGRGWLPGDRRYEEATEVAEHFVQAHRLKQFFADNLDLFEAEQILKMSAAMRDPSVISKLERKIS